MTTNGATLKGMASSNQLDVDASQGRFVGHRPAHWTARPVVPLVALVGSIPGPLAKTAQMLQSDTTPGAKHGFRALLMQWLVSI